MNKQEIIEMFRDVDDIRFSLYQSSGKIRANGAFNDADKLEKIIREIERITNACRMSLL